MWEVINRHLSERRTAQVTRVAAHNTVVVRWTSNQESEVGLWGICSPNDAPVGTGGATKALNDLRGEWVIVRVTKQASEGGLVGEIFRREESVSAALVEQGLACYDLKHYPSAWDLLLSQWRARRNRVGIWDSPVLSDH
jgi:endonuclease YncB( thermonuclease family)